MVMRPFGSLRVAAGRCGPRGRPRRFGFVQVVGHFVESCRRSAPGRGSRFGGLRGFVRRILRRFFVGEAAAKIKEKLKSMAYAKWPETLDALVKEKSDVSDDGSTVKVSAVAIQYESSTDRAMLHKMNEGMVASPSGN